MSEKARSSLSFRNLLANFWQIILLFMVFMVLAVTIKKLRNPGYSIQSFQMPKHLIDQGLNGQVFAMRIRDQIDHIKRTVNSAKDDSTATLSADVRPDLNLEVLGIGFSTNHLLYHLADLFGVEPKSISGDLTDVDQELRLTLRGTGLPMRTIIQGYKPTKISKGLDSLVLKAGEHVLEQVDPYRLAIWHFVKGNNDGALQIIRKMIKDGHPDKAWAHCAWGNLSRLEDPKDAIYHYQKAIEIDPNLKTAYNNLGWIYFQEKLYPEAIEAFEQAREREPSFGLNNGLAQCYMKSGDVEKAEEAFQRNLKEFPEVLWGYGNYAEFLVSQHNDTLAAAHVFQEASKHIDESADYFSAFAAYYVIAEKYDSADIMLHRALDYDPANVATLQALVQTHLITERYEEAEPQLKRYIAELKRQQYERSMLQSALNSLAMNDYRLGKYDSALVHANQAIDVNPTMGFPYSTLAETYYYVGEKELFYQAIEQAVERGFNLNRYKDEEPYDQFLHEERFQKLLAKKLKD